MAIRDAYSYVLRIRELEAEVGKWKTLYTEDPRHSGCRRNEQRLLRELETERSKSCEGCREGCRGSEQLRAEYGEIIARHYDELMEYLKGDK